MHYAFVNCPCGEIRGIGTDTYDLFKGIPYATAARWEAPQDTLSWEGIWDGTTQGKACPQNRTFNYAINATTIFYQDETVEKQVMTYGEDCLNLNIWRPANAENLPVLIYIHGGSYENGNGALSSFKGISYCKRGVILVTINYRLNAFAGAIGDGYCGNFGLQDQISALRWVQRNISAFGGDPERVTIMGESAGAMSVQNLVLSPMAKDLFHGAIMLSGGGLLPKAFRIKTPENMICLWEEIKSHLGAKTIDDLKQTPAKELYITWKSLSAKKPQYATPATPVIDGHFLPEAPKTMAEKGEINRVPMILSVLSEDMWPHTLYNAITQWADLVPSDTPVYGMYFDRALPGSDHGAFHGCDVRYVFGTLDISWRPWEAIDYRISEDIMDYFTSFAKTGIPQAEGRSTWLPLTQSQRKFMHFGDAPCAMTDVPAERLAATEAKGKPFPTK